MAINKVVFEGLIFELDTEVYKHIAKDRNGDIYAYEELPEVDERYGYGIHKSISGEVLCLYEGSSRSWEYSCVETSKVKITDNKEVVVGVHPPFRYNGYIYENVPNDLKWIATDKNGRVYAYDTKPKQSTTHNDWFTNSPHSVFELLATERPCEFFEWTGSLLEIEEILKHEK